MNTEIILKEVMYGEASPDGHVVEDHAPPWPTLAEEARYGLPSDALEVIEPNTEADPAAVLANFLTGFGNAAY